MFTKDQLQQLRELIREENEPIKQGQEGLQADVANMKKNMATKQDVERVDKRLDTMQQDVAHISTAINALPTKGDVEETVEAAKAELKADIQDSKASIMQQTKRQGRWIETIAEKTETPNPNKN